MKTPNIALNRAQGGNSAFALVGSLLAMALNLGAWATPEAYNRLYIESSISASPAAHTEIERTEQATLTLDVEAEQVEFGASEGLELIRAFDLLDASGDGATFLSQTIGAATNCEGSPPCPESVSISATGYLTLPGGSPLNRPKGLLAPNAELFASVYAEEGRVQGQGSETGFEVIVAKPAALTLAQLSGNYQLVIYTSGLERDVVGNSSEDASAARVELDFNGDGTCAGGVVAGASLRQDTDWPLVNSRQNVFAALEEAEAFLSCAYTVDADAGTTSLVLELSDGGDTFMLDLTLFVSESGRYLVGRLLEDRDEGISVGGAQSLLIGARSAAIARSNADLAGVYFLSSMGETFTGTDTAGVDTDFVSRIALEFSSNTPDPEGFSVCTVLGTSLVGPARTLGGSVPAPSFVGVEMTALNASTTPVCRFRALDAKKVVLELSTLLGTVQTEFALSDDAQTLIGSRVGTTEDPLPAGVDVSLEVPGIGLAELLFMQRYAGTANNAEVADFAAPVVPALDTAVAVVASVLPAGRAVQVGETATAFATIINGGDSSTGIGCDIRYSGSRNLAFFYQQTNPATNAPIGERNVPVDVPAGVPGQSFFFGITPFEAFAPEDIELEFSCLNANSAATLTGLNTLLLSASTTPVADVIALGATVTNNGIALLDGANRTGFFSLASVNVGSSEPMFVSVDTGEAALPLLAAICQTNSTTGVCENPTVPSSSPVSVTIAAGATPTFAVFLSASETITLDPANSRVFVRFSDATGAVRGATSVAVQAP